MLKNVDRGFVWRLFPFFVGFVAISIQTVFVRLTLSIFQGNEIALCIVLGHWLLLTGVGSRIGAKLRCKNVLRLITFIGIVYVLLVAASSILCVFSKKLLGLPLSEILGVGPIFFISFVVLVIPSILNGIFFPLLVKAVDDAGIAFPVHKIYSYETFGSAVGGVFIGLFFFSGLNSFEALFVVLGIFLFVFLALGRKGWLLKIMGVFIGVGLVFLFVFNRQIVNEVWKPQTVEKCVETRYSSVVVASYQGMRTLFSNSSPLWVFGNEEKREELVHFPLLYHPRPETVLVVGTGNYELAFEVLKHKSVNRVIIIQKDRVLQSELNSYSNFYGMDTKSTGKVKFMTGDPVRLLERFKTKVDVVILNIPLPTSAYLNSYYSLYFISRLKDVMKKGGILAFHLPGGERFLSREHVEYLKVIGNTAQKVFRHVYWIPGNTIHLLATDIVLDVNFDVVVSRLKQRKLDVKYIREYYLVDRLSPFKIQFLNDLLAECKVKKINTVEKPIGFYYETILWDKKTGGILKDLYKFLNKLNFKYVYLVFLTIPFILLTKNKKEKTIKFVIFSIGFISMSLVGLYVMIYQSYAGGIYLKIFLINLGFMLGAGLGARIIVREERLLRLGMGMAFVSVLLLSGVGILLIKFSVGYFMYDILIPVLTFFLGVNCGFLFPVLTGLLEKIGGKGVAKTSGVGYSLDVIGACIGIYVISAIFVPVFGLLNSIIFLVVYSIFVIGMGLFFTRIQA